MDEPESFAGWPVTFTTPPGEEITSSDGSKGPEDESSPFAFRNNALPTESKT